MLSLLLVLSIAAEPADWQRAESVHLHHIRQVTHDFVRAGEGYFSPDGRTIIFQAEEKITATPSIRSSRRTWPPARRTE